MVRSKMSQNIKQEGLITDVILDWYFMFTVKLEDESFLLAYVSAAMFESHIEISKGDRVEVMIMSETKARFNFKYAAKRASSFYPSIYDSWYDLKISCSPTPIDINTINNIRGKL